MRNTKENNDNVVPLVGNIIRDDDNNSTALIIPKEFVRALDIENSKVLMSLLDDFHGNRHLIVTKCYDEFVIN